MDMPLWSNLFNFFSRPCDVGVSGGLAKGGGDKVGSGHADVYRRSRTVMMEWLTFCCSLCSDAASRTAGT